MTEMEHSPTNVAWIPRFAADYAIGAVVLLAREMNPRRTWLRHNAAATLLLPAASFF